MNLNRDVTIKLIIVAIGTIAALATTNMLFQLIQVILPFLIVAAGVYIGYRWALNDSKAPTVDELAEQMSEGINKTKDVVETTAKVGKAVSSFGKTDKTKEKKTSTPKPPPPNAQNTQAQRDTKTKPNGEYQFKDRDVVISKNDIVQPDIARLEEKEKAEPKVTDDVYAQLAARRKRLNQDE